MPILRHANTLLLSLALLCQCALANADATCDAHLLAPRGLDTIKALIRDDCLGNTNDDAPVMREVTLIDPDGYLPCAGVRGGPRRSRDRWRPERPG